MKIKFLGGVKTVTGSHHLIEVKGKKFLLDCGLFQGRRQEARRINENPNLDLSSLSALILSHAHIDHSGNLPTFARLGFAKQVYSTFATYDLANALLRDSAYIQERDAEFLNKKLRRGKEPLLTPLYTLKDSEDALKLFIGIGYHKVFSLSKEIKVEFFDAGHVLGSSLILLEITESTICPKRLGYIVDLGRKNLPFLKEPEFIPDLDYIIIESTYGGRIHPEFSEVEKELSEVITRTFKRKGKIVVPAFALERTQEIIWCLNDLRNKGMVPEIPIYVDSPLAINITEIFRLHPECFEPKTKNMLLMGRDPFGFEDIIYTRSKEESQALNELKKPALIISASGMCENGRILHHLRHNIENPKNTILIVGYMAQNTLGRKIVEREKKVRIFGEEYKLKAEVVVMNAFSGHADRNDLLNYVKKAKGTVKKIFVVHGDPDQSEALVEGIKELGIKEVYVPEVGDEVEL
ncbi:MAG: MBL fold metallo-hydrolase [Candidatus Omnitrophica bacterium]|nr:MBL fold metallo-hydrolase [Candidatus Omnitrophota bacterium]MCM8793890.1 MBL fold metallo-hydrolase [Candidatus Omnitrophota bacterium]